jgi:long-chain fatty acid transport protein
LGLNAVRPSFEFSDRGSVWTPVANTGTGTDDAGSLNYIPNGYISWGLNKDLYVGVGFSAPFGLKTEYDPTWVGQFQAISFEIKTYNINPSIAYRVNDRFSVGFGINWQRLEAEYVRQAAVTVPTVRVKLSLDDDSWGWNAGFLYEVSPTTRVGVSYRSSIKHDVTGDLNATNPLLSSKAKASIELPDTLILSTVQKLNDKWTMVGDLSWTGWSSIPKVDIIRSTAALIGYPAGSIAQTLKTEFRNTWRFALGGIYQYSGNVDLKFGIAYDQTPVKSKEQRLVSLPDNDRLWLSAGAQWKISKDAKFDLGAAYLYVRDTDIDNNQIADGRGRVTGTYDSSVWILGAQYSRSF